MCLIVHLVEWMYMPETNKIQPNTRAHARTRTNKLTQARGPAPTHTCDVDGFHLFERTQGMAFGNELGDRSLMQSSRDQQDDVVDHVRIPGRNG